MQTATLLVSAGSRLQFPPGRKETWTEWFELEEWARAHFDFIREMAQEFPFQAQLPPGLGTRLRLETDMVLFDEDGCLFDSSDNQLLAGAQQRG